MKLSTTHLVRYKEIAPLLVTIFVQDRKRRSNNTGTWH